MSVEVEPQEESFITRPRSSRRARGRRRMASALSFRLLRSPGFPKRRFRSSRGLNFNSGIDFS